MKEKKDTNPEKWGGSCEPDDVMTHDLFQAQA